MNLLTLEDYISKCQAGMNTQGAILPGSEESMILFKIAIVCPENASETLVYDTISGFDFHVQLIVARSCPKIPFPPLSIRNSSKH